MRYAFLLLSLLAGCATTGAGEVRRNALRFDEAGPASPWRRLKTSQVEFLTDLPEEQARRAAQLLTQSLDGLRAMFGNAPVQVQHRLVVIALADDLEFERRFGKNLWGFAMTSGEETTVCLYGNPDRWFVRAVNTADLTHSVLQHELAHAVLARYFVNQPTWFAEGMAQYLETFRWVDDHTVLLGEPNVKAWNGYAAVRSVGVKDLLGWGTYEMRETETAGYYGLAWALVHWAINREPQRFSDFLAEFVDETPGAFERAFGPLMPDLDRLIHQYLKERQYVQRRLEVPLQPPVPVHFEASAAPAERLELLGRAWKK